jgi:hypothetical protein
MGYVIDYDDIDVYDLNPDLASSVKALMWQRSCAVSVTITTGPIGPIQGPDVVYLIINEYYKSRGVYKQYILCYFFMNDLIKEAAYHRKLEYGRLRRRALVSHSPQKV